MSLADIYKAHSESKKPSQGQKEKAAAELAGIPLPELRRKNKGLFHTLLDILDRPGNATRGLLVGKFGGLKGLIPFAQTLEDLTGIDFAMDKEDLTSGGEVVEKWFNVKNTEGKLDLNDVLGITVEILADPLWLVGGFGLTKAGKLGAKTASMAKTVGGFDKLKDLAKAGKLTGRYGKKIARYVNNGGIELAEGWAKQAKLGQRGIINIMGKPLVKGSKTFGKLDKHITTIKRSKIGSVFYRPTKRVSSEFNLLDEMKATIDSKYLAQKLDYRDVIQELYDRAKKLNLGIPKEQLDDYARKYVELAGTQKGTYRQLQKRLAKRGDIATKRQKQLFDKMEKDLIRIKSLEKKKALRQDRLFKVFKRKSGEYFSFLDPEDIAKLPENIDVELYAGGFTNKARDLFADAFNKSPYKSKELTREDIPKRLVDFTKQKYTTRVGVNLGKKEAIDYANQMVDNIQRSLSKPAREFTVELGGRGKIPTKGWSSRDINKIKREWSDVEAIYKAFGLTVPEKPFKIIKGAGNEVRVIPRLDVRTLGAVQPSRLQQSGLTKQQVLKAVEKKGERLSKYGYAIGEIDKELSRLNKSVQSKAKLSERLENFFKLGKYRGGKDIKDIADLYNIRDAKSLATYDFVKGLDPKVADELKNVAGKYSDEINPGLLQTARNAGLDISEADIPIGYGRRRITPEGLDFIKKSERASAEISRRKTLAKMTTEEAEQYFRDLGFKGKSFFEAGMADPTMQLADTTLKRAANRELVTEAIKKWGGDEGVSAAKLLKDFKIDPKLVGLSPDARLPEEVYSALMEIKNFVPSQSPLKAVEDLVSKPTKYWKASVTAPWPGFHARNFLSNIILNWEGEVVRPSVYLKAMAMKAGKKVGVHTPTGFVAADDIARLLKEHGVSGLSFGQGLSIDDIADSAIRKTGNLLNKTAGLDNPAFKIGRKAGTYVEDVGRIAHFIDKLEKGYSVADAATSAKKYLFDYGNLSAAEKRIKDIYIPFYVFARKNAGRQFETLLNSPAKTAVFSHLMGGTPEIQGNDKTYPDWWRERLVSKGFKLPGGKEMRIAGFGAPIEEAFGNWAGAGYSPLDSANRIAQRQFSRLSPAITAPIEAITGKDIFYGRDIADTGYAPKWAGKAPEFVKKPLGIKEVQTDTGSYHIMNPRTRWAISKSPLSRLWSSASMIADDVPAAATLSNTFIGLKPRVYDPVKLEEQARKEQIEGVLEEEHRKGNLKRFTRFYQPKTKENDERLQSLLKQQ